MTTVQTASLLENVSAYFDQAAALTTHPKGLPDQIKTCNSIYVVQFPFRREHGYEVGVQDFDWLRLGDCWQGSFSDSRSFAKLCSSALKRKVSR